MTFLGGLGEIGRNCACLELDGKIMLIDCGLMFPDFDMLGVDLVLPDFTWIRERADRIEGVVLTHGHEDHVGALPVQPPGAGRGPGPELQDPPAADVAEQARVGLPQALRAPDEIAVAQERAVLGLVVDRVRVPPAAVGEPRIVGPGRLPARLGRPQFALGVRRGIRQRSPPDRRLRTPTPHRRTSAAKPPGVAEHATTGSSASGDARSASGRAVWRR